jgi:hypothetical protein
MSVGKNGGATTQAAFWAAPDLAKAVYPVFPLNDKEPSVKGGFYAATRDLSQVAEWIIEGREHHDVAFATGIVSGVVILDADSPETAAEMEAAYGPPHVRTRGGGHWYFRHPRNGKVTSNNVRDGLDRKGDGVYVAAPPSRGRTWTDGIPERSALPMLPREFWPKKVEKSDALRTMVQDRKDAAVEAIAARVPRIPQGKRHGSLRHLCGVMLARDTSPGDAEDILIAAWEKASEDLAERAGREVSRTRSLQRSRLSRRTARPACRVWRKSRRVYTRSWTSSLGGKLG